MDGTVYNANNALTWQFMGFNSLLTQKVGVISGYAYGEELDALIKVDQMFLKMFQEPMLWNKTLKNSSIIELIL
ncbi:MULTISPECIES: hypothetical protein [unclassified Colwellia]|uniref:hypothetical protein n=1 Tax=unclassified Colwellia TaxID=196834 RepID=UPI0021753428|nr:MULTISPECIES: hypothetical protein [unclassified Colwellia]